MERMRRHAVTGGAGFIGSHIVGALLERGDDVVILDDFSTGKQENLDGLEAARVYETEVASEARLVEYLDGVDTVFHESAIASVSRSIEDPQASHRANVDATLNLLRASVAARVRRVVYASSSAVYGDCLTLPLGEGAPIDPLSPYGAQKYCSEIYMRAFWRAYGLETVSLRYFNVFGPRQDASSPYSGVIARFIPDVLASRRPRVFGDGQQSRDFVYVANVVEANLRAAAAPEAAGGVFNVASGRRVTLVELLDAIQNVAGTEIEPVFDAPRKGDILHSQADITRAGRDLDWSPAVGFTEGLRETLDWYRNAGSGRRREILHPKKDRTD